MRIDFCIDNSVKATELFHILHAEIKKHFMESDIEVAPHKPLPTVDGKIIVSVCIENSAFFWDVYRAKEKLYKEKGNLEDFVSDVEEKLSFVCDCILVT